MLARWIMAVGILVGMLIIAFVVRDGIGTAREADLQRMDRDGYRCEMSISREDSGPFSVGSEVALDIEVKNTGLSAWEGGERPVALGMFVQRPIDKLTNREGHASNPQVRFMPEGTVLTGKSFKAEVRMKPDKPGVYRVRFQMVKEGNPPLGGWFGPILDYKYTVQ